MSEVDATTTNDLSDEELRKNLGGVNWQHVLKSMLVVLAVGVLALPLVFISSYIGLVSVLILMFAVMATGYNVMLGWPNLLVFCPSAFAILGGVASAVLATDFGVPVVAGIVVAGLIGAFIGVLVAYAAIIIDSIFEIVIATLAFEQLVFYLLVNSETVGSTGIVGIPAPSVAGFEFATYPLQYLFLLVVLCLMVGLVAAFDRSLLGTLSIATGENQDLVRSIGYSPSKYKLISISLGAFILGIGGALFAHIDGLIVPSEFTLTNTVVLLIIVTIGGLRTIYGPVLGAVIIIGFPEVLRSLGYDGLRPYFIGLLMILVILAMPAGIVGTIKDYADGRSKSIRQQLAGGFGGEQPWLIWK